MTKVYLRGLVAGLCITLTLGACNKAADQAQQARVESEMKQWLAANLSDLHDAAQDLQRAAPVPSGRGWSASDDGAAIAAMKEAWGRARTSYELVEGALAPLFPESDLATDARYDDFLTTLGAAGDKAPFDDQGVVGMHAIERILWADSIPKETVDFETSVPGYRPAAFPITESEARDFKEKLAARLVTDVEKLQGALSPLELDIAFAFRGLIDLTNEQREKVDRAATGREESRYAQATLKDLRANRDGCLRAYKIFQPWLLARGDSTLDEQVVAAFERLRVTYDGLPGGAIPRPPRGWSSLEPEPAQLETPFGQLFRVVSRETDDKAPDSLSGSLMNVADALSLPKAVLR